MSRNIIIPVEHNRTVRYRKRSPGTKTKCGILERYTYKTDTGELLTRENPEGRSRSNENTQTIRIDCDSTTDVDFLPKNQSDESDSDCQIVGVQTHLTNRKKIHSNQIYMIYSGAELANKPEEILISDSEDENVQINKLTSSRLKQNSLNYLRRNDPSTSSDYDHQKTTPTSSDDENSEPAIYEISDNIRIALPKIKRKINPETPSCSGKQHEPVNEQTKKPRIEILSNILINKGFADSTTPVFISPAPSPWKAIEKNIDHNSQIIESIPSNKEIFDHNESPEQRKPYKRHRTVSFTDKTKSDPEIPRKHRLRKLSFTESDLEKMKIKIDFRKMKSNQNDLHENEQKICQKLKKMSPRTSKDGDVDTILNKHPRLDPTLSPETMKSEFYSYLKINTNPNSQKTENTIQNRRSIRVRNLYKENDNLYKENKKENKNDKSKENKIDKKTKDDKNQNITKRKIDFPASQENTDDNTVMIPKLEIPLSLKAFKKENFDHFIINYFKSENIDYKSKYKNTNKKDLTRKAFLKKSQRNIRHLEISSKIRRYQIARMLRSSRQTRHSLLRVQKGEVKNIDKERAMAYRKIRSKKDREIENRKNIILKNSRRKRDRNERLDGNRNERKRSSGNRKKEEIDDDRSEKENKETEMTKKNDSRRNRKDKKKQKFYRTKRDRNVSRQLKRGKDLKERRNNVKKIKNETEKKNDSDESELTNDVEEETNQTDLENKINSVQELSPLDQFDLLAQNYMNNDQAYYNPDSPEAFQECEHNYSKKITPYSFENDTRLKTDSNIDFPIKNSDIIDEQSIDSDVNLHEITEELFKHKDEVSQFLNSIRNSIIDRNKKTVSKKSIKTEHVDKTVSKSEHVDKTVSKSEDAGKTVSKSEDAGKTVSKSEDAGKTVSKSEDLVTEDTMEIPKNNPGFLGFQTELSENSLALIQNEIKNLQNETEEKLIEKDENFKTNFKIIEIDPVREIDFNKEINFKTDIESEKLTRMEIIPEINSKTDIDSEKETRTEIIPEINSKTDIDSEKETRMEIIPKINSKNETDSSEIEDLSEVHIKTEIESESGRRSQIESGSEFDPKIDNWQELSQTNPLPMPYEAIDIPLKRTNFQPILTESSVSEFVQNFSDEILQVLSSRCKPRHKRIGCPIPNCQMDHSSQDDSTKLLQQQSKFNLIKLDENARVKPFHRSLQSSSKMDSSIDPFQEEINKTQKQTHQVTIDHQDGPVFCSYYTDGTLILIQEYQIGFWKQTPLGNVLGASNMWYSIGKTKRYVFEKGCVCRRAHDMVSSAEGSVAYIEVWTKEHSSEFRQLPVTDIFVTIYHHKGYGALDKKVLQLENIKGYGKNVRYCVMRYSREIVVSWRDQLDPKKTYIRSFELASDFQTIVNIREFKNVYEEITSMHIITSCDSLVIGATENKLFVWNVKHGWLVKTIDFKDNSPTLEPKRHLCLKALCETGYLFVIQQTKKRFIRLVGVNGVSGQWKQLQLFRIPRNYNTLLGTSTESGTLMLSYPNGFLCYDMQSGKLLAETEFQHNRTVLPADKFLVYVTENGVSVKHVMLHILEYENSQDDLQDDLQRIVQHVTKRVLHYYNSSTDIDIDLTGETETDELNKASTSGYQPNKKFESRSTETDEVFVKNSTDSVKTIMKTKNSVRFKKEPEIIQIPNDSVFKKPKSVHFHKKKNDTTMFTKSRIEKILKNCRNDLKKESKSNQNGSLRKNDGNGNVSIKTSYRKPNHDKNYTNPSRNTTPLNIKNALLIRRNDPKKTKHLIKFHNDSLEKLKNLTIKTVGKPETITKFITKPEIVTRSEKVVTKPETVTRPENVSEIVKKLESNLRKMVDQNNIVDHNELTNAKESVSNITEPSNDNVIIQDKFETFVQSLYGSNQNE